MGMLDAINEGWLVPPHQKYVRVLGLDYSRVDVRGGDFAPVSLSSEMREPKTIEAVCAATYELGGERKSLVFCVDVQHAEDVTAMLNEYHPGYAHIVTGTTPKLERSGLIRAYRQSDYPCLVTVGIATEGFDVPDIQTIVMARATQSPLVYEQMLGRGTRALADIDGAADAAQRRERIAESNKPEFLVVDFVGNSFEHEIVRVIDVLGGKMSIAAKQLAERELEESGGGSVIEAMRRGDEELQRLQKTRSAKAVYQQQEISPFKRASDPYAIFGMSYEKGSHPIEDWQKEKLEKWRMPVPETVEEAQDLIDEVRRRARLGLCTYRMARQLKSHGRDPNMPFDEARAVMQEWFGNEPRS
jgi:superfamily II DNA or RNA helicase